MKWRTVWAIAWKDLVDALRNARLLLLVIMPIGFSVLYGYLFRDTPTSAEIVIYSPQPSALVTRLGEMEGVSLFVVDSPQAVAAKLAEENAALGVVLPTGFDEALRSGERPQVELLYGENADAVRATQRLLLLTVDDLSGRPPAVRLRTPSPPPDQGEKAGRGMDFLAGLDLQGYFVVLWVVMGLVMTGAMLVPTLVVEEKEKGTLDALLVTPAGYSEVVTGKVIVGMVYALIGSLIILALNGGFTGDVAVSLAAIVLGSLALTLIGLLLGGLVDNLSTLNTWSSFIMLPLLLPILLAAIPLGRLGFVAEAVKLIPTYHLVRGLSLALTGRGGEAWGNLAALAGVTALLFGAVLWSLRRQEA